MIYRMVSAAALTLILANSVAAAGCPAKDGTEFPGIEVMNQQLVDGDYAALTAAISEGSSGGINLDLAPIEALFPDGFDACTTVAQRYYEGGMTQNIVVFRSAVGPLFVYWYLVPVGDGYLVHTVSLNTDPNPVLDHLF